MMFSDDEHLGFDARRSPANCSSAMSYGEGASPNHRQHAPDGIVKDSEIADAVEAYFSNSKAATFEFASGHVLDFTAAVTEHRQAKAVVADKERPTPSAARR